MSWKCYIDCIYFLVQSKNKLQSPAQDVFIQIISSKLLCKESPKPLRMEFYGQIPREESPKPKIPIEESPKCSTWNLKLGIWDLGFFLT